MAIPLHRKQWSSLAINYMDKWVMLCGDKYKGALHVRVK